MKRYSQSFIRVVHVLLVVALLLTFAAPAFAEGGPTPNQFDIPNRAEPFPPELPKGGDLVGTIEITIDDSRIPATSIDGEMPTVQALNDALVIKFIPVNGGAALPLTTEEINELIPEINITDCADASSVESGEVQASWTMFCHFWWPYRRIWSGWLYSPYPDLDYFMYYRVPPRHRREVCITRYLADALRVTHKRLSVKVYRHNRRKYYDLYVINIGHSVARNVCQRLHRSPNCANWLLNRQAVVRYQR